MSDDRTSRSSPRRSPIIGSKLIERTGLVVCALAAVALLYVSTGQRSGKAVFTGVNLRTFRMSSTNTSAGPPARPPPARSCPPYVLEAARNQTPVVDFATCLREHGKPLDIGAPDRYLIAAEQATDAKERLNLLTEHVLDVWLWTLSQREGTPCKPMLVLLQCLNNGHCSGVGDRVKGLQTAFWMAVMTNSIFVHDVQAPAPLEEFFLPLRDEVNFWDYRGCFEQRLRRVNYRPENPVNGNLSVLEDFHVTRDWRDMDYVHVRSNLGHVAHVLRMRHYQATLDRLQMQDLPLSDFLYITNRVYLSQPAPRLQRLAQPLLDEMMAAGPATLKVGVQIRVGDSKLPNALKKGDIRYPPGATICWVRQVQQQCNAVRPRPCACFLASDSDEARELFLANMTALGIPAVVAPGETLHIDWINGSASADTLLEIASKSYLDWYMLTQMDGLSVSTGGYGMSAAYSTLAGTITYMHRIRPSSKGDEQRQCIFEDYRNRCVGTTCPGQVTESTPEAEGRWTLGNITQLY